MTLPVQTQAVADERGLLTPTWRRWLADLERRVGSSQNDSLASDIAAIATALGSPDGTVGNIPEQASMDALIVGLDGILTEGRLSSGRVTVRLVDLEDTGEGAGLYKITRDAKGRVEGTQAATAADLAYDNTTSGLTATDAQAAIDELAAGGGSGGGGGGLDLKHNAWIYEDFLRGFSTSTNNGINFATNTPVVVYTGNGGSASLSGTSGRPAQLTLTLNTTAGSYARPCISAGLTIAPGGGVIRIGTHFKLPNLSNATDRYEFVPIGFLDAISGAPTNRLDVAYSDNSNSGNWVLRAWNAGVATSANAAVGPVANTETLVELEINAAGNSATLYVDGASVATLAISFTGALAIMASFSRTAGNSNSRTAVINYMSYEQALTNSRG